MSRQRRTDTAAELALRRALHALGYRYRVNLPLPGMPRRRADVTFTKQKVVVFVDGCFWHGCPEHRTYPKRNGDWWAAKLRRNIERDVETESHLSDAGWTVVRVWEHASVEAAVAQVESALEAASNTA